MKKQKSTKRALLMSALSLLLCLSMLVGTTFAWFTDSVTSGINTIAAGNLDVELYHSDKKVTNEKVDATTKLFDDILLWEPGVAGWENLTVKNEGTLQLKYQLSINFENATKTPAGKTLADVLAVGLVPGGITKTTREEVLAEVDEWIDLATFVKSGKLNTTDHISDTYGIVIYWEPSNIDNEFNMNNGQTTVLSIDLGVKLLATQLDAEEDSFGPDYDKDSACFVSTTEELRNALANVENGGTVYVNDGTYNIDSQLNISGKSVNIVGVGENAVIRMTDTRQNYNKIFYIFGRATADEDITVNISNVTLTADVATKADIWIRTDTQSGAKVSGDVTVNLENVTCASVICDNNYVDGDEINLNVTNSSLKKVILDASPFNSNGLNTYTNLTYENSRIDSISIQPGVNDLTHIKINGVNPTANGEQQTLKYISTAEELVALGGTKTNGTYVLMADLDMTGYEMKPIQVMNNDALIFDGNGHTISNITIVAAGANGMTGAGNEVAGLFDVTANASSDLTVNNLMVKNASVACSGYAAAIVGYANSATDVITLNNVDVIGAVIASDSVAALVGYTVGPVTLTDCDVSGLVLTGEAGRPEKVGALVGTANQTDCTVVVNNCTNATSYNDYGRVINGATWKGVIGVNSADTLQKVLDKATGETTIALRADITGNVTATQKPNIKVTIDGNGNDFNGILTVNGQSARYETAALTIQNINFVGQTKGTDDAYVKLGGNDSIRYTNNVTVKACTFSGTDMVAVKSYTGGDWNVTLDNLTVNSGMHSLAQFTNIEKGLKIVDCKVYSKNGANLNNTPSLEMSGCEFDTIGYCVRFGVAGNTNNGTFTITDSTLKSACADGDAVIMFRGDMAGATLDLTGTTLEGSTEISGR